MFPALRSFDVAEHVDWAWAELTRTAHIQKARARARLLKTQSEPALEAANDAARAPVAAPRLVVANEVVNAPFANVEDLEPPFDPPDEGDFDALDVLDADEETPFAVEEVAPEHAPESEPEPTPEPESALDLAEEEDAEFVSEPDQEPALLLLNEPLPELIEAEAGVEAEVEVEVEPAAQTGAEVVVDEEPPFDAPDESDDCFQEPVVEHSLPGLHEDPAAKTELLLSNERPRVDTRPGQSFPRDPRATEDAPPQPAPAITVLACWDRPETGALIERSASDHLLARADVFSERGGVFAAIENAAEIQPDLVLVESTLPRQELLAGIDRLTPRLGARAKIIVIGAVNDITLLRDLAARGVNQYIVPPFTEDELVRAVCALYADTDNARVIAVVGARGGVGASTLAYNLAWSMAERQQIAASLLDLDVAFGAGAFHAGEGANLSAPDIVAAPERLDETPAGEQRLRLLTAPASLQAIFEPSAEAAADLIARVRRTSSVVVMDVPHAWNAWVKQALISADDVIIVAAPDLASLRNAEHMMHILRAARGADNAPFVVLSQGGVAKRPEIALKDFSETLASTPVATLPFEPEVFGVAEVARQAIGQSAPRSKAAAAIDSLASMLTGREPIERKKQPLKRLKRTASAPVAEVTTPEVVVAPSPTLETPPQTTLDLGQPIAVEPFKQPAPKEEEPAVARPFTFRAGAEPLELTLTEEEAALAKANDASINGVADAQAKRVRRGRPGLIRALVCLVSLIALGAWYFHGRQHEASASAPFAAAPVIATPTVAPATTTPAPRSPAEQYEAALQALTAGQIEPGLAQLRTSAEAGFAPAQYRLAKLYEHGQGVPTDLALARQWTERAAASGESSAMHDLGVYFARGEGVPADDTAAFRWFRQAAERGVVDSQFNLGVFYEQGRGVAADETEALFWFLTAGRAGDLSAIQRANALEARLSPMQVDQAHARALAFRPSQTSAPAQP